jgi:hypothetical protein
MQQFALRCKCQENGQGERDNHLVLDALGEDLVPVEDLDVQNCWVGRRWAVGRKWSAAPPPCPG